MKLWKQFWEKFKQNKGSARKKKINSFYESIIENNGSFT